VIVDNNNNNLINNQTHKNKCKNVNLIKLGNNDYMNLIISREGEGLN